LPQLDTSTFASQIFWVLIGFLLVYLFVSKIFVPKIEMILQNRDVYVDGMLAMAHQLKNKAALIEDDAVVILEDAKIDVEAAEAESLAIFRERNLREKKSLYSLFSKKSKRESDILKNSAQEAYANVGDQMDELMSLAMANILSPDHQAS
jgi:F-type H+-transporting ATPase subunit b